MSDLASVVGIHRGVFRSTASVLVARYVPLVVLGLAWEIVSASGLLPREILPPMHSVLRRAVQFFLSGDILPHLTRSMERATLGFCLAVIAGVGLGAVMARSAIAHGLLSPLLALTNSIPKPAFYPLFLIWLGAGDRSDTAVIFTGCVIPVLISTYNGTRRVHPSLVWMGQNLGMTGRRLLWRVVLPAALPEVLMGIRISLTLAWVMLVSAEMLAGRDGLGFLIGFVGEAGDYEGMFAVVVILATIGFIADRVFLALMAKWLTPYRG